MIRAVVCSPDARDRVSLRSAVAMAAEREGIVNVHIVLEPSPEDLARLLTQRSPEYIDLLVCRIDGESVERVVKVLSTARDDGRNAYVVLVSSDEALALNAYKLGNAGVYNDSHPIDELVRMVVKPIKGAYASKRQMFAVKNSEGLDNIPISDLLFVETNKKELLAHLPNGKTTVIRSTMQALSEQLQSDRRFFRAGSSFLVNLDNVRSLGEGSVIFPDGESIIVPVRTRGPLKQALEDYRAGV